MNRKIKYIQLNTIAQMVHFRSLNYFVRSFIFFLLCVMCFVCVRWFFFSPSLCTMYGRNHRCLNRCFIRIRSFVIRIAFLWIVYCIYYWCATSDYVLAVLFIIIVVVIRVFVVRCWLLIVEYIYVDILPRRDLKAFIYG